MNNNTNYKVAFLGPIGSFSEEALYKYFGDNVTGIKGNDFLHIFELLENGDAELAILPCENNSTGTIAEAMDLVVEYDYKIVGETILKIEQNLLGIKGTSISDVDTIYSISPAYKQSKPYITKNLSKAKIIPTPSTAESASIIKELNKNNCCCIASKRCAKIYGLDIISEHINMNSNNSTRFVIISKEDLKLNDIKDKVSMSFVLPHTCGSLFKALEYFSKLGINLLRIESKPIPNKNWEYMFYVDLASSIENDNFKLILSYFKDMGVEYKILGCYKGYDYE